MLLKITKHAKRRMHERGITQADLQYVLSEHNRTKYPSKDGGGKWVYEGRLSDGRRLVIVTVPAVEDLPPGQRLVIVSTYSR